MASKNQPHDTGVFIGLAVFVLLLIGFVIWLALSAQISSGIRWIRIGELNLAGFFTDDYKQLVKQYEILAPHEIKPMDLLIITDAASEFMRVPITIIFALMALVAFFQKEKHPYARRLDLEGITKEQATAFPVTSPILKFNPLKENFRSHGSPIPEKLPPFAEALTPDEWVGHNSIPVTDGVIDKDAARLAFARQLGKRWAGVNALPLYAQALFAAFSMKANGLRTETDEFLGELSQCWQPGKGLVLTSKLRKKIKKTITDPKFGRVTEKIAALHSFVNPALLRCLLMAREGGGVLAPAQFLWLRAVDRHMWYALNNLGRSATHAEACGSIAHYRTEKASGKPIPNPQVDTAVEGLVMYLKENDIKLFPAKEYARSARSKKQK